MKIITDLARKLLIVQFPEYAGLTGPDSERLIPVHKWKELKTAALVAQSQQMHIREHVWINTNNFCGFG